MPSDPSRDSFWRRFSELQPDVDVVLLPPEPARQSRDMPGPEALADAEESAQQAVRLARELWDPLTGGLEAPPDALLRWVTAGETAVVRAEVTVRHHGFGDGAVAVRVDAATAYLGSHDWRTSRRDPSVLGAYRLIASRQDTTVELAVYPDPEGVVLTVRSPGTEVGDLASRLLRSRASTPFEDRGATGQE